MSKLKSCPHCGSEARLVSDFKEKKGCRTANVRCSNNQCLAEGYISDSCLGETEKTAIDKWNRRVKCG
jgi:Lar family restriction alleviation protein